MEFSAIEAADVLTWLDDAIAVRGSQQRATGAAKTMPPQQQQIDAYWCARSGLPHEGWAWRNIYSRPPPLIVCVWPFDELGVRHFVDGHVVHGYQLIWQPEQQPQGPFLFVDAHNAEPFMAEQSPPDLSDEPRVPNRSQRRPWTIAVLDRPETAPATPEGTHALVQAALICREIADRLTEHAAVSLQRDAAKYRREADELRQHADAAERRIDASMTWLDDDLAASLFTPIPPFAPPVVPAVLRGSIVTKPYQ